jgi:arylsulfatase A-like enzyme
MTDSLEKANLYQVFKEDYAVRCGVRKENPFLVRPSPLPVEHYLDSYVGRVAEEYLASYEESCPLCLFVGFPGPHEPWDAPGEYATMYAEESVPDPIPWSQGDLPESIAGMEDFRPMGSSTLENIRRVRTNYYGKISLIDSWIGRIIETCVERGIWDDAFVAFWSDHGDMLGDHRRVFKSTFHESSMRVPLLLRWPDRFPRGVVLDSLVEIIDFHPTLMESLGGETPTRCQGRSLVPLTDQVETEVRTTQLSEILHAEERRVCLRTRSHKYAVRENGDGFMLYDLEQDPFEQDNLIGRAPEMEARVREMLFRRLLDGQYSMERSSIEGFPRGPHRSS